MKFCAIILTVLVATSTVLGEEDLYSNGTPRVQSIDSGRVISRAGEVTCLAGDVGFKCSTCTTGIFCIGAVEEGNQTCSSPNGFCDSASNSCSNVKPEGCDTVTDDDFKCSEEGFFPNPKDCNMFYFCDSSLTANVWDCPDNFVWDALLGVCKRMVFGSDCVTITCTKSNVVATHPRNPNYYYLCNAALTAIMFKCPTNMQYNAGCKYVCKAAGYFPGKDARQYYLCTKNGLTFTQSIYTCPEGWEYNSSYVCIKTA